MKPMPSKPRPKPASSMPSFLTSLRQGVRDGVRNLGQKTGLAKPPPLASLPHLSDFVRDQAAFVSQVALYTYVKARSGTSFPKLFQHQEFLTSLHIARWHIFAAAVIDLAVFAAMQLLDKTNATNAKPDANPLQVKQEITALAHHLGEVAFAGIDQKDVAPKVFSDALGAIAGRVKTNNTPPAPTKSSTNPPTVFFASADAFLHWAPMAEAFKKDDEEIMRNSIEMRWIEVRRAFHTRLKADAVYGDWRKHAHAHAHAHPQANKPAHESERGDGQ